MQAEQGLSFEQIVEQLDAERTAEARLLPRVVVNPHFHIVDVPTAVVKRVARAAAQGPGGPRKGSARAIKARLRNRVRKSMMYSIASHADGSATFTIFSGSRSVVLSPSMVQQLAALLSPGSP